MKLEDEDKTAFRTGLGIFYYTKMPFGLKNASATYQRLMDKIFAEDIGKHIEVYIDDLVIKSPEEDQMLKDIEKTFNSLRSVNMKLNPTKCSFGMEEGKFLGFVVTNGGFRVNPEKVQTIERMPSPRTIKEMHRLAGRLAALNRFLSNHAAKSYPFISTLRNCVKKQEFKWTPEAETAFQQMKECLIKLPTLTAPFEKEPLILYLSSSDKAVGSVLLVERDGVQTRIYYVSRVLTDPETRYSTMEKLVLALLHASRRLRRYFTGHVITVLTNFHIGTILQKPETSGRPRPVIKGQVLTDFVTEVPVDKIKDCEIVETPVKDTSNELWLLYTDGASNEDGAGAGLRLVSPEKHEFTYAIKLDFKNTNNEAEYEAFLAGLRLAIKMGAQNLRARVDSLLIASQINGLYDAKGEIMALYLDQAKELLQQFKSYKVVHINRSENKPADALSKLTSTSFQHLAKGVRIEVLKNPSVLLRQVNVTEIGQPSWMNHIIQYLQEGILPENKAEARKIQHKALHYEMNGGILYRKSFLGPLLRYVDPQDANYLISEIHEGICGIHAGPRMVVAKIINAGYYWPGMHVDALKELRKCDLSHPGFACLRLDIKMGAQNLRARVDSLLIASQINGLYDAKGEIMALYLDQAKELLQQFKSYKVVHINRSENKPADALSKLASTSFQHLAKGVRIEVLKNPSVLLRQVNVTEIGQPSWMNPIIQYLQEGILPENKAEARKIQHKALHYEMNGGILYRKSFLGPLLRYVDPQDANYLISEIHEGICGIHAGPRMVVAKIINAG
ncbi:uncharacterized protein LOC110888050 [Helianthus annuus]|uniref:uncharacterized protein LOC110888050 n=1 Tax=Helianthus annuus TaxID=4232 RepID=UPI000B8F3DE4|nr:uncharacterized protein LOC110888050 [Helianthus annuus]